MLQSPLWGGHLGRPSGAAARAWRPIFPVLSRSVGDSPDLSLDDFAQLDGGAGESALHDDART
jgi:hypothetical protein